MTDEAQREKRRAFVREHRTAIFGYPRKSDGPSMSVVYYVMDGDNRILVSTMRARSKAKAVQGNPKVSLCILDEQWPLTYLQVYCTAEVDPDLDKATDLMMRISGVMAGEEMPESARADVEGNGSPRAASGGEPVTVRRRSTPDPSATCTCGGGP